MTYKTILKYTGQTLGIYILLKTIPLITGKNFGILNNDVDLCIIVIVIMLLLILFDFVSTQKNDTNTSCQCSPNENMSNVLNYINNNNNDNNNNDNNNNNSDDGNNSDAQKMMNENDAILSGNNNVGTTVNIDNNKVYGGDGVERDGSRATDGVQTSDLQYDEDYNHFPIADGHDSLEYEYGYSFMPPSKWYSVPPRPPLCVAEKVCPVCPMNTNGSYLDMKEWNDSIRVSQPDNINTKFIKKLNAGK